MSLHNTIHNMSLISSFVYSHSQIIKLYTSSFQQSLSLSHLRLFWSLLPPHMRSITTIRGYILTNNIVDGKKAPEINIITSIQQATFGKYR